MELYFILALSVGPVEELMEKSSRTRVHGRFHLLSPSDGPVMELLLLGQQGSGQHEAVPIQPLLHVL